MVVVVRAAAAARAQAGIDGAELAIKQAEWIHDAWEEGKGRNVWKMSCGVVGKDCRSLGVGVTGSRRRRVRY